MPHVITQSCCSDGSCVFACPVNCIHPSPDEPGLRDRRDALHRSRRLRGLRCLRERLPGRRDRARHQARTQAAAVHRTQRVVLSEAARASCRRRRSWRRSSTRRRSCAARRTADGGDRRLRPGGDVRRRRAADPAAACGSTSSRSCRRHTVWCGPASHPIIRAPSGSPGCSTGSRDSRGFTFYLNVEVGKHV